MQRAPEVLVKIRGHTLSFPFTVAGELPFAVIHLLSERAIWTGFSAIREESPILFQVRVNEAFCLGLGHRPIVHLGPYLAGGDVHNGLHMDLDAAGVPHQ